MLDFVYIYVICDLKDAQIEDLFSFQSFCLFTYTDPSDMFMKEVLLYPPQNVVLGGYTVFSLSEIP